MSYRVHRYRGPREGQILISLFKAIWFIISLPFRLLFGNKKKTAKGPSLDKGYVRDKWNEIENLMHQNRPSAYTQAVLEADKLLDHILKAFRAPGMTMADRLKASRNRFSPDGYNAAWRGHRLRNEIVHNSGYQVLDYTAKAAIANYKKAIGELV